MPGGGTSIGDRTRARVDVVRWAEALDCGDVEELSARLGRACGEADVIASEVAGLQSSLAGLAGAGEEGLHELLLRLGVMAEGVWMVLDHARRAAEAAASDRSATVPATAAGVASGGVR